MLKRDGCSWLGSNRDRSVARRGDGRGVVVPLRLTTDVGTLALFSTTTVFGTPIDITLSELAIEGFFPADAVTAELLRQIAHHERG